MAGGFFVLASLSFLALAAAFLVVRRAALAGRAESALATMMLWNALVVAPIYALGFTNHLRAKTLAWVSFGWFALVIALAVAWKPPPSFLRDAGRAALGLLRMPIDAVRWAAGARSVVLLGVLLFAGTIGWCALTAYYAPSWRQWDALWYHEPMIGFAIQNHGFSIVTLPNALQKINGYPRLAEMTMLWFAIFTDRRLVDLSSVLVAPALAFAVYVMALRYEKDRVNAMAWGVAVVLTPACANLLGCEYVDIHTGAYVLAAMHFCTRPTLRLRDVAIAAVCLTLALGAKILAIVPVGVLGVLVLVRLLYWHVRARPLPTLGVAFGGIALLSAMAASIYLRNYLVFKNPFWPDLNYDNAKLGIHWVGSDAAFDPGRLAIPFSTFLDDFLAIPYRKDRSYYGQTYDYGFAFEWMVTPFAIFAFFAAIGAQLRSLAGRLLSRPSWRAAPETWNLLLLSLPVLAMLYTAPALWGPRYLLPAIGVFMVTVAWAGGREGWGRFGKDAAAAMTIGVIISFFWAYPRWWLLPSELHGLMKRPYPEREVTPASDFNSPGVDFHNGSAITRDVGLLREQELFDGAIVAVDDTYNPYLALFWNNRFSNKVVYLGAADDGFIQRARDAGATWVYISYGDRNSRVFSTLKDWEKVGNLGTENWGTIFRRKY